jgi:hypothetical protein
MVREQRSWRAVEVRLLDASGTELGSGRLAPSGFPAWATAHARGVGSARAGAQALVRFAELLRSSG